MKIQFVDFTLTHKDAKAPTRAHQFDAGNDLYALEDAEVKPGEITKIRTGVCIALPNGTQGIIKDRSSMGSKGLHVFAGVIDAGYTGEISVILYNANSWLTPKSIMDALQESIIGLFGFLSNKNTIIDNLTKNLSKEYEEKTYHVKKGDKIAQLIVSPITAVDWSKKETLNKTDRGSDGFGSSGK